jgi:hypothetical protein
VAGTTDEHAHAQPAEFAMLLAIESGDTTHATQLADAFAAEREALLGGSFHDYGILSPRIKYLVGAVHKQDFERARAEWLAWDEGRGRRIADQGLRWVRAYAQTVRNADDAQEALKALPSFLPLTPAVWRPSDQDFAIGYTYLMANRLDESIAHLRRGTQSCSAFEWPIHHTWAHLALGQALERKGDVAGACSAYSVVVKRWGMARTSNSANHARTRAHTLGCPI